VLGGGTIELYPSESGVPSIIRPNLNIGRGRGRGVRRQGQQDARGASIYDWYPPEMRSHVEELERGKLLTEQPHPIPPPPLPGLSPFPPLLMMQHSALQGLVNPGGISLEELAASGINPAALSAFPPAVLQRLAMSQHMGMDPGLLGETELLSNQSRLTDSQQQTSLSQSSQQDDEDEETQGKSDYEKEYSTEQSSSDSETEKIIKLKKKEKKEKSKR